MKKRKIKRYTLVGEEKTIEVYMKSLKTLNDINIEIYGNNNDTKSPCLYGDVIVDKQNNVIKYKQFRKLTKPLTLEEIDKLTVNFPNQSVLIETLALDSYNLKNIYVAYRVNKKIRLLRTLYENNKEYISRKTAKIKFLKQSHNIDFITKIINSQNVKNNVRLSSLEFDNLYKLRDELKYKKEYANTLIFEEFYYRFIYEGGSFNYFNFRILMILLIEYRESTKTVINEVTKIAVQETKQPLIEEQSEQIIIPEYERDYLKSLREDKEIERIYGKSHTKKLIP